MMRLTFAAVLAAALTATTFAQQGPRRDGRWQVRMEMTMPGMPSGMPPISMEQCVTKEEAENPETMMPQGQAGPGGMQDACKVTDQKVTASKVTWAMTCDGPEPMSGTGEFTYSGDTYEGLIKMDRQGQSMTMKYTAKRLGDCTK